MIYVNPVFCIETHMEHIRGHIKSGYYGQILKKWPKLPKIAIMAWSEMSTNMVNIGFHAKSYIDIDHL